MKVLVLGASGMLGNAVLRVMHEKNALEVFGAVRSNTLSGSFTNKIAKTITTGCDVGNSDDLLKLFNKVKPDIVINCIGLIKQLAGSSDPLISLPINTMLPHRLSNLCEMSGARFIHMSTDCVFSGLKGNYKEEDVSDATDLYGKSKYLGEVDYSHAVTLRTSIIGHELQSSNGLISWFLSQQNSCKGFRRAVFSGLPTVVLARIIRDIVIPKKDLTGLYHVAAKPISKYDLLKLVADVYGKKIELIPDDGLVIDRSLNADKFNLATGYTAPEWTELINEMHSFQ